MDEIMNNTSWYNTASTTDGSSNITFTTTDVSDSWFPYYQESTWLPYHYESYKPEWHIKVGYKKQISSMWDN